VGIFFFIPTTRLPEKLHILEILFAITDSSLLQYWRLLLVLLLWLAAATTVAVVSL
jgi:hypothetical protein